jgi:hypothetical protein
MKEIISVFLKALQLSISFMQPGILLHNLVPIFITFFLYMSVLYE